MQLIIEVLGHKSSDWPTCSILFNDQVLFDGIVEGHQQIDLQCEVSKCNNILSIVHHGKVDADTWCDSAGNIIADKAVELKSITIDGFVVPELILFKKRFYPQWPAHFNLAEMPKFLENNLFFGFNGTYEFDFSSNFVSEYYQYFWDMELMANETFQKTESGNDVFEMYGVTLRVDSAFSYTLSDLKALIEQYDIAPDG